MRRKEVIKFLNDLEKDFPVNTWKAEKMDLWPLVKRDLFFTWNKKTNRKLLREKEGKRRSSRNRFKYAFLLFKSLFCWVDLFLKPKKSKEVIFAGSWSHRVDYKGSYINRYYYPLIHNLGNKKFLHVEYHHRIKNKKYPQENTIIFIENLFPVALLRTLLFKKSEFNSPAYDKLMETANKTLGVEMKRKKLFNETKKIQAYSLIYKYLFNKYTPNKCIGLCYYNTAMFAFHYVANMRGIENFDMQHGAQGSLHPMYFYENVPFVGYNILPQKFWVWDQASFINIESWITTQKFHEAELKGNPWIRFQLQQDFAWEPLSKKIILYTLQEDHIDDYILKAIRESPKDWEWWLRLHPRKTEARKQIESRLIAEDLLERVEISKATDIPLPQILQHTAVHISKFSGSIIEGIQIGVPTVVIDKIGGAIFKNYIDNGDAGYLPQKDDVLLMRKIKEVIK